MQTREDRNSKKGKSRKMRFAFVRGPNLSDLTNAFRATFS